MNVMYIHFFARPIVAFRPFPCTTVGFELATGDSGHVMCFLYLQMRPHTRWPQVDTGDLSINIIYYIFFI